MTLHPAKPPTQSPTPEHLLALWREWRHERIADISRPYGWPSLIAQYWLREGDTAVALENLPGTWAVIDGRIVHTPAVRGPNLSVDGMRPNGPVEIKPDRNQAFGDGESVPVYFGPIEIETIVRTDDDGERIYSIRLRDPRESARKDFSDIPTYQYDPAWRLPTTFEPLPHRTVEQVTVERGVHESTTAIGKLAIAFPERVRTLTVLGKQSAGGMVPILHLRDLTSGMTTDGAGRVIPLRWSNSTNEDGIDLVDLNYLIALPCAFTNFVTCPLPPAENHLDFAIEVGEKSPTHPLRSVSSFQRDTPGA